MTARVGCRSSSGAPNIRLGAGTIASYKLVGRPRAAEPQTAGESTLSPISDRSQEEPVACHSIGGSLTDLVEVAQITLDLRMDLA